VSQERFSSAFEGKERERILAVRAQNDHAILPSVLGQLGYQSIRTRSCSQVETEDPRMSWTTLHTDRCDDSSYKRAMNLIERLVPVMSVHDCAPDGNEIELRQHVRVRVECMSREIQEELDGILQEFGAKHAGNSHTTRYASLTSTPCGVEQFLHTIEELTSDFSSRRNPPLVNTFDVEKRAKDSNASLDSIWDGDAFEEENKKRKIILVTLHRSKETAGVVSGLLFQLTGRNIRIHACSQTEIDHYPDYCRVTLYVDGISKERLEQVLRQIDKAPGVIRANVIPEKFANQHAVFSVEDTVSAPQVSEVITKAGGKIIYRMGGRDVLAKLTAQPMELVRKLKEFSEWGKLRFARFAPVTQIEGDTKGF